MALMRRYASTENRGRQQHGALKISIGELEEQDDNDSREPCRFLSVQLRA
jgi:hypothetical protein